MIQAGTGFGGEEFNAWKQFSEQLSERIANASCELHAAEFNYLKCPKLIDTHLDDFDVLNCGPLEEAVNEAALVVNRLENRTRDILFRLDRPGLFSVERMKLMKELQDINKQAPPAKDKLTAARTALDNCKKNLPSDIGSA